MPDTLDDTSDFLQRKGVTGVVPESGALVALGEGEAAKLLADEPSQARDCAEVMVYCPERKDCHTQGNGRLATMREDCSRRHGGGFARVLCL